MQKLNLIPALVITISTLANATDFPYGKFSGVIQGGNEECVLKLNDGPTKTVYSPEGDKKKVATYKAMVKVSAFSKDSGTIPHSDFEEMVNDQKNALTFFGKGPSLLALALGQVIPWPLKDTPFLKVSFDENIIPQSFTVKYVPVSHNPEYIDTTYECINLEKVQ